MRTFETDILYLGIFANADESILQLQVPHFEIKKVGQDEVHSLVTALTEEPLQTLASKLYHSLPCFNHSSRSFFAISHKGRGEVSINHMGGLSGLDFLAEIHVVQTYVHRLIAHLRFLAEGDICIPLELFYFIDEDRPRLMSKAESFGPIQHCAYKVTSKVLEELIPFDSKGLLPLNDRTLALAWRYCDGSYRMIDKGMEFLMLMTGMEVLFNRGKDQITYTISRYTAVLLGQTPALSKEIFKRMKKLYGIRSDIVHEGDAVKADEATIRELRGFLRDSIKALLRLGLSKEDYCSKLDALGFGQPPA